MINMCNGWLYGVRTRVLALAAALVWVTLAQADLSLREAGEGTDEHTVSIEAPGHFRLAAVRAMNYGLSEWYDLANDPAGKLNILHRPDGTEGDQGSLFNQVINPGDLIGHIRNIGGQFKDSPRSCVILERNAVRVILQTTYHPMLNRGINTNIILKTTYAIYGTGRIGVENTLASSADQTIELWRNSTLSIGDPTFHFQPIVKGEGKVQGNRIRDESSRWTVNAFTGLQVNLPDWVSYEIVSNTEHELVLGKRLTGQKELADGPFSIISQNGRFGWLRCSDRQSPYSWQPSFSDYLRMYWDPETPEPFTQWTKASIMLVPKPANPNQGWQSIHGWDRFKRFYYEYGKFDIKAGEGVTQQYRIQLGAAGDTLLPDLSREAEAQRIANDYRAPASFDFETGAAETPAFDYALDCYRARAQDGKLVFSPKRECLSPVFDIAAMPASPLPSVTVDGQPVPVVVAPVQGGRVVVQCLGAVKQGSRVVVAAR